MKSIKFTRIILPILLFALLICIPANLWCQSIKVACIGDSITYGWGFSDRGTDSPPAQLQRLLGSGYTVNNYGVSGATLMKSGDKPYWDLSVYTDSTNWLPNIVIIMLGTNDSKSSNWAKKANFVTDSLAMINHYKDLSSNPVVYLATCPKVYGSGNYGITDPIVTGEIVPLQKQVASQTDTPLIDMNAATSNMSENFPDKVHPNVAGAAVIAQVWYTAITSSSPAPTPPRTMGDVSGDGTINIVDALLIAQYYVGLNPVGFVSANADVNCSEDINIVDALLVAQYYVGLITAFEGC